MMQLKEEWKELEGRSISKSKPKEPKSSMRYCTVLYVYSVCTAAFPLFIFITAECILGQMPVSMNRLSLFMRPENVMAWDLLLMIFIAFQVHSLVLLPTRAPVVFGNVILRLGVA